MSSTYNKYYLTENLFGEPYPELIAFLTEYPNKGMLLDVGCGQGRDAIALARLGYSVTGIDHSSVGIDQMNQIGQSEKLNLIGKIEDVYAFDRFDEFDIVLIDSMFHFAKNDKEKEIGLVKKIVSKLKKGTLLIVCIQDTGNKVQTLKDAIGVQKKNKYLTDKKFNYTFKDEESEHHSVTNYRLIAVEQ